MVAAANESASPGNNMHGNQFIFSTMPAVCTTIAWGTGHLCSLFLGIYRRYCHRVHNNNGSCVLNSEMAQGAMALFSNLGHLVFSLLHGIS